MSLEIIGGDLEVPKFNVVDGDKQVKCKQFLALFTAAMNDKNGIRCYKTEGRNGRANRVYLGAAGELVLHVARWTQILEESARSPDIVLEAGVLEPDGEVRLRVEGRKLAEAGIGEDPFSAHIIDTFRERYGS